MMSKEYDTEIMKLITDVDSIKYNFYDYLFREVPDIGVIGLLLVVFLMVQTLSIGIEEKVYVQLLIASGALTMSALVFYITIFPKWDVIFSEYKARKICKSLNYDNEETKVLLMALISMKVRQPKIKLSTIYKLEPETFTKKTLYSISIQTLVSYQYIVYTHLRIQQ